MCRPSFTSSGSFSPSLEVRGGRHPCVIHTHSGGAFIPNDVLIEGSHSCLLVTGPNMGGKSTLMRQTGLIVVLAQLVCTIPPPPIYSMFVNAVGFLCPSYQM